jgi:hypothetical protein
VITLVCSLLAACTSSSSDTHPTLDPSPSVAAVTRDYWPTVGWRTAPPTDHGIDPKALAEIGGQVDKAYPQIRSVLIVRHGYLIYEHYCHGLDQSDGHDVRSFTKSVIGTLVGIVRRSAVD